MPLSLPSSLFFFVLGFVSAGRAVGNDAFVAVGSDGAALLSAADELHDVRVLGPVLLAGGTDVVAQLKAQAQALTALGVLTGPEVNTDAFFSAPTEAPSDAAFFDAVDGDLVLRPPSRTSPLVLTGALIVDGHDVQAEFDYFTAVRAAIVQMQAACPAAPGPVALPAPTTKPAQDAHFYVDVNGRLVADVSNLTVAGTLMVTGIDIGAVLTQQRAALQALYQANQDACFAPSSTTAAPAYVKTRNKERKKE